jgi:hypothetical protein
MDTITNSKFSCINCNRNVDKCYYIFDKLLCNVCDRILQGGTKECRVCKQQIDINLFERPYLTRCKQCAKKATREHYKENKDEYVLCWCGKTVNFFSLFQHKKTKAHLAIMQANNYFN